MNKLNKKLNKKNNFIKKEKLINKNENNESSSDQHGNTSILNEIFMVANKPRNLLN